MISATIVFWTAVIYIMCVIAFGTIHYRVDKRTDVVYSVLLLIGVVAMVVSGVVWVITNGG